MLPVRNQELPNPNQHPALIEVRPDEFVFEYEDENPEPSGTSAQTKMPASST